MGMLFIFLIGLVFLIFFLTRRLVNKNKEAGYPNWSIVWPKLYSGTYSF